MADTGLSRREHITPALELLGWRRIDGMLEERDAAMLRRLMSSGAPPSLVDLVRSRSDVSVRATRGVCAGQLELPRVRTERGNALFRTEPCRSECWVHESSVTRVHV